ncbi:MAG: ankyrin repeat domain-containing protein [Candidatus Babeliales bacterium]
MISSYFFQFLFIILSSISCFAQVCVPSMSRFSSIGYSKISLGQQLLQVIKQGSPEKFKSLLMQAVQQNRGNKQAFFEVINTRDENTYNILHFTTLIGDLENIAAIFDALKQFYGNDKQGLFKYLDARDKYGLNVLGFAEYNADKRTMQLVLTRTMQLIGEDKELFFKFMNAQDSRGWRPLLNAADDAESDNMQLMVQITAHVLGQDSQFFLDFLNAKDFEGYTALDSVRTFPDELFLKKFGAKKGKEDIESEELKEADRYGRILIESSNRSNFALFEKTLKEALAKFKDQKHMLFHFLYIRDDAGWTSLINAATDGQYEYVKILLEAIEELAMHEKELIFHVLSATDFQGRTALHLALLRHHYDIAHLLIDAIIKYSDNTALLLAILNTPNEFNGFTPLITAVYSGYQFDVKGYENTKLIIEKIKQVLDKNSRMFWLFMNARDYNGWTPLAYAADDRIRALLKSYGAIDTTMPKIYGVTNFESLARNMGI